MEIEGDYWVCDGCGNQFWQYDLEEYNHDHLCNDCMENEIADRKRDEMKDERTKFI